MRLHTFLGRLALPVAVAGLTTIGAAAPAHAAPEPAFPEVEVFIPDRIVTLDGRSKTVEFQVVNVGEEPAEGLSVRFTDDNGAPVPAAVGLTAPQGCTVDACAVGALAPGADKSFKFTVTPTAGLPELGETLSIAVRGPGGDPISAAPFSVLRTDKGVDLELAGIKDVKLAPGGSATLPITVRNAGNETQDGVAVILAGEPFLSFPNTYSNCFTIDELFGVACAFDQPLGPDEVFTVSAATPLKVKVAADAPGPADYFMGAIATGLEEGSELGALAAAKRTPAGKSPLKLVPAGKQRSASAAGGELNPWDNVTSFFVKVSKNPADSVAVGATFAGAIGDTRTVKVGVRNDGPAATLGPLQGWVSFSEVTIPAGVELTKVDRDCIPAEDDLSIGDDLDGGQVSGRDYLCIAVQNLKRGEQALFSFTGRITAASPAGSVTVDGGPQDPKRSNDIAKIEVKLTSGGSGGGLPVTGAPTSLLAAGGALLLAAGVFAVVTTRRRTA
ncbi:hypothetical protein Asp14428_43770 [Actinoplanes sp. NBRC 14428]|nr:hypothetical protein Asp14428_43770 [Actinoplanes sp. NBRC 14428]